MNEQALYNEMLKSKIHSLSTYEEEDFECDYEKNSTKKLNY